MSDKLLTEHHMEFLNLKGGCTCSSESIHVKMPHCWKSHVKAQLSITFTVRCNLFTLHIFKNSVTRLSVDHRHIDICFTSFQFPMIQVFSFFA